jgi:outer membrane lipoprotein-sorting protein
MIEQSRPRLLMPNRRRLLQAIAGLPAFLALSRAWADEPEELPPDAMTPVHERYGQLTSYADTGTLTIRSQWPGAPESVYRSRFETAFRAPRNFFFRFDAEPDAGGDIYVLWCDGGDFQSWWKATGVHEVYSGGRGVDGFYAGGYPSGDAIFLLGAHVFPQALPYGPSSRLINLQEAGEEAINGHACSKFVADGRQTGVVTTDIRPTTIWVDKEITLVRKVQTDAQDGSPKDVVDTHIYDIEPTADPDLPDDKFTFTPPE